MSKSRARLLAELLNSAGRVKKDKSDLAGADSIIDLDTLPTITNAKLENSSISIAGHSTALGGSVSLDTADISEHTDYPYFTNARARGAISVSGSLSYNSSTGVLSYTQPTNISTFTNDSGYITSSANITGTSAGLSGTPNITVGTLTSGAITSTGSSSTFTSTSTMDINLVANPPELNFEDTSSTSGTKRARWTLDSNSFAAQGLADDDGSVTQSLLSFSLSSGAASFGGTLSSGAITATGSSYFGSTSSNNDQHIRGNSNVGLRIQTNAQGTGGADGMRVGLNGVHAFVWQFEELPLAFATNNTERLSIAATGGFDFKSNPLSNIGTISSGAITSTGKLTLNDPSVGGWIQSNGSIRLDIDNDNDQTNRAFIVSKDNGATTLLTIYEDAAATFAGNISVGGTLSVTGSSSLASVNGTYFSDGYVTWNAAQFNRSGAYIELQWSPVNSSAGVRIGGNTSNPIVFDAYNGTISGALASSVTATTQSASDNSTKVATTAYVDSAVSGLVDSAPGTLNTLNELAAALGDDANFSTTVTNSIATKLPLAGGTMTGNINMGANVISNLGAMDTDVALPRDHVIKWQDGGSNYSNIIKAGLYPSQGYTGTNTFWIEYAAKGGHNFIVNTDGGSTASENTMDHFTIWQGAVDGRKLFWVTNSNGHVNSRGSFYPSGQTTNYVDSTRITNWQTAYGWGNHASQPYAKTNTANTFTALQTFSGTADANWKLSASNANASWRDLEFEATTEWGDASAYGVLGGTTGIMVRRPHTVWSSSDGAADIRFGRSGGTSSGSWYGVGTLASNVFSIHKDSRTGAILTFNGSNTWDFKANNIAVNGTTVIDSSRNITAGTITTSGSGSSTSPVLGITSTNSSTFIHASNAFAANMTAGQFHGHFFGKAGSTKNAGGLGYYWAASGSDSNFVSIGHWGADHLLRLYGNGNFNIHSGALQLGGTTVIDSSRNLTNIGTISSGVITTEGTSGGKNLSYASNFAASGASIQLTLERTSNSTGWGGIGADVNYCFSAWGGSGGVTRRFSIGQSGNADLLYGDYKVNGTTVIDSSRNLTNIGTISSGAITTSGTFNQTTSNSVLGYLKSTNTGTSGYAEYHIRNDANEDLVIGSIGSNYSNTAWAGSRYIYSTAGELRIKAKTNLRLYSGGYEHTGDLAITMDSNQEVTIHKDMNLVGEFNGSLFMRDGRITVKQGTGLTSTILVANTSSDRAQLLLDSSYSDMIIASRQTNANKHGSTLTFATQSTSTTDYRKIVVGQGQYQEGYAKLAFAYGENQTNPHTTLGVDNAEAGVVMDLYNKRIGVGGGVSKDPLTTVHVSGGRIAIASTSNSYGQLRVANTNAAETTIGFLSGVTESTLNDNDPTSTYKWAAGLSSYTGVANQFVIGNVTYGGVVQISADGKTTFGETSGVSANTGRVKVGTDTSSGWGTTSKYPYIGSDGTGPSLIMFQNPHVVYRTDNARSGASGRAGLRMARNTSGNWWDMGLTGDEWEIYRDGTGQLLHLSNAGKMTMGLTDSEFRIHGTGTRTRKIVLYDGGLTNNYQFYGFGVEGSSFINSIYDSSDTFYWYAGTTNSSRQLAMSLSGTGALTVKNDTFVDGGSFTVTDHTHNYLRIESASNLEQMVRFKNSATNYWYAGIRTSNGIASTADFHIFSSALNDDAFALTTSGDLVAKRNLNTKTGSIQINGTSVIDSSRNLTNIGTATFSGPVGINVAPSNSNFGPLARKANFHIKDTASTSTNATAVIECADQGESSLYLCETSGTQGFGARLYYEGLGNNFFNIEIIDDSGGTKFPTAFSIDRDANVGINKSAPVGRFDVHQTYDAPSMCITSSLPGNWGPSLLIGNTVADQTLVDGNDRPMIVLDGSYPVINLNHTVTSNDNHGPTIQFTFDGLTTGGTTGRQIVIGTDGAGNRLDFGFAGGGHSDNSNKNPHNGIAGYLGSTPMRLFHNGLAVGSLGTYPNELSSVGSALEVYGNLEMSGSFLKPTYHQGFLLYSSGTASSGSAIGFQQVTAEGWTGIFVDYNPYEGWGLYHDNPSNYFYVTAETTTGSLGTSFTVPNRGSGSSTAYAKIRFDQNNGNINAGGAITANGNITAYASDRRLKTNFRQINSAVDKVKQLNGMIFDWNEVADERGFTPDRKYDDIGLIAQEVEAIVPQAVELAPFDTEVVSTPIEKGNKNGGNIEEKRSLSGEDYLTVNYSKLVPLLVNAIKEQSAQIDAQQEQINQLTTLVNALMEK